MSAFTPVYPQHPLLRQYIYCYYCLESNDPFFFSAHDSFPHTYNALSIYDHADVILDNHSILATGSNNNKASCILQGKRLAPLQVRLNGIFSRITIIFYPLGLNQFIRRPLGSIMGAAPTYFREWESAGFTRMTNMLFNGPGLPERLHLLEDFLLNCYYPASWPMLQTAFNRLSEPERPVAEIAAEADMSLRTFNRLFRQHVAVGPACYRQIIRFRQAMQQYLFETMAPASLTRLGYQQAFYDQPHFIRFFRQLSGMPPQAFFRSIERLGDTQLVFRFTDD